MILRGFCHVLDCGGLTPLWLQRIRMRVYCGKQVSAYGAVPHAVRFARELPIVAAQVGPNSDWDILALRPNGLGTYGGISGDYKPVRADVLDRAKNYRLIAFA